MGRCEGILWGRCRAVGGFNVSVRSLVVRADFEDYLTYLGDLHGSSCVYTCIIRCCVCERSIERYEKRYSGVDRTLFWRVKNNGACNGSNTSKKALVLSSHKLTPMPLKVESLPHASCYFTISLPCLDKIRKLSHIDYFGEVADQDCPRYQLKEEPNDPGLSASHSIVVDFVSSAAFPVPSA